MALLMPQHKGVETFVKGTENQIVFNLKQVNCTSIEDRIFRAKREWCLERIVIHSPPPKRPGKADSHGKSQVSLPLELRSLVKPLLDASYCTSLPEWKLSTNCLKWNCLTFPFPASQHQSMHTINSLLLNDTPWISFSHSF